MRDYTHKLGLSSTSRVHNKRYLAAVDTARSRTVVVFIFFIFLWGAIGIKLILLALNSEEGSEDRDLRLAQKTFQTGRSRILDRNGVLLATSVKTVSLYCNPRRVSNVTDLAKKLHKVFPKTSVGSFEKKLSTDKNFVWLMRSVTPSQHKELLYIGNPELKFIRDEKRIYPQGRLFSHLIGLVNMDNQGLSGLEKALDDKLRRNEGDLMTSIDLKCQYAVRQELIYGMKEFEATAATAIVMDVRSSEILAIVSLPDFDPNNIRDVNHPSMFNRAVSGIYEMGSTMKIVNTALGLSQKGVSILKTYDTSEELTVGRYRITDYRANHGPINIAQIFVHSSNKGSARIALDAGGEQQQDFFNRLGLLKPASFELPESSRPLFPKRWREANTITASYGYGIAISPLQLLNAAASVTIDGCLKQATLFKSEPKDLSKERLMVCERIVSAKVARQLRQLMFLTATQGTSKRAYVPGFYVGAKTGTRDMLTDGKYDKNRVATSFVGLIGDAMNDPRYMVVLMLEDPKRLKKTFGFNAAGWNAAPVGGRILNRIAVLMGLKPTHKNIIDEFDNDIRKIDFAKRSKT